jgi:hypothetical protein
MNPYLEQPDAWHDFHESFMPLVRDLLTAQVDPRYIVKIDEHIFIHELDGQSRGLVGRADMAVVRRDEEESGGVAVETIPPPAHAVLPAIDIERVSFLQIVDRRQRQLVTAIELLSPSNKAPGPHRDQYLLKREEILASTAHLIEIDLLRGGRPMPIKDAAPSTYRIIVSRYQQRPEVGLWPLALADPLPAIPVPLKSPDADARIELQEVLHRIYDSARYGTYLYDSAPEPPLSTAELQWARRFVPQAM